MSDIFIVEDVDRVTAPMTKASAATRNLANFYSQNPPSIIDVRSS